MKFLEKIKSFFKKIFHKEEVKMLNKPLEEMKKDYKQKENEFLKSLRVDIMPEQRKNKIETLICIGDGTGIQNKVSW